MNGAMQSNGRPVEWDEESREQIEVLDRLLVPGGILPTQLPAPSHWTPELSLAAAVLAQAMADIRWRRGDGRDHIQVNAALRWVRSDDASWPLSFPRICELLQLDPTWVRERVAGWMYRHPLAGRNSALRHAA